MRLPHFIVQNIAVSSGSGEADYVKMKAILKEIPAVRYICLDVANGYSEAFVQFVRSVRADFPSHTIMVSLAQILLLGTFLHFVSRFKGKEGQSFVHEWTAALLVCGCYRMYA